MSKDISDYETLFEDETSAFYQASRMITDGIIHPEDTRQVGISCIFNSIILLIIYTYISEIQKLPTGEFFKLIFRIMSLVKI